MAADPTANILGVAETKARFSELIDRVERGERFVVERRGKQVLALVSPSQAASPGPRPLGLAAIAGAMDDWDELPEIVEELYAARRGSRDRPVPDLD